MRKKIPEGFKEIPFDKREGSRSICAYCLHKADSRDHLPPESLFPDSVQPLNKRTVPCCKACNHSFSEEDDDWFRNIMTAYCGEDSTVARNLLSTKVVQSGVKQPHLLKKVSRREEWVELRSPNGIYLGKRKNHMPFTKDEEACITRMLHRLCKGYYWVIYKRAAPLNTRVKLMPVKSMPKEFINAMGASQWASTGNPDVFIWTALPFFMSEEPLCFFWFTFYRKFAMIVLFHMDKQKNVFGRIPSSPLYVPQ